MVQNTSLLKLRRQAAISELEKLNDFRLHFQCIGKIEKQLDDRIIADTPVKLNINILTWIVRISWLITAISLLLLIIFSFLNIPIKIILTIFMNVIFINGIMSVFFLLSKWENYESN